MEITSNDIARFWSKVIKTDNCWVWNGSIANNGYGEFSIGRRNLSTHRFAWMITNGKIPSQKYICHTCDNKLCVRPDHLYVGTHADNTRDAVIRHRMATGDRSGARLHPESYRGENHHNARLTEVQVSEIRNAHGVAQRQLAKKFGVHFSTICDILRHKSWKHIP